MDKIYIYPFGSGQKTLIIAGQEIIHLLGTRYDSKLIDSDNDALIIKVDYPVDDVLSFLTSYNVPRERIIIGNNIPNFRDVFKNFKRRSRNVVRICPVCGSKKIRVLPLSNWLLPETYICEKCGYRGFIILEVDENECGL